MSEKVTAYRAKDGKLFETLQECSEYDFDLEWRGRLEDFFAQPETPYRGNTAQHSMAAKVIIAWERYKMRPRPVDGTPVAELELTVRSTNCLVADGVKTVEQLCRMKVDDVFKTPNLGRKSLREIRMVLAERNLFLADDSHERQGQDLAPPMP